MWEFPWSFTQGKCVTIWCKMCKSARFSRWQRRRSPRPSRKVQNDLRRKFQVRNPHMDSDRPCGGRVRALLASAARGVAIPKSGRRVPFLHQIVTRAHEMMCAVGNIWASVRIGREWQVNRQDRFSPIKLTFNRQKLAVLIKLIGNGIFFANETLKIH